MAGTAKLGTYLGILSVAAAGSFLLPDGPGAAVRLSLAAAAVGVLVAAILVRRPPRRTGWWLIAVSGSLTYAAALAIVAVYGPGTGQRVASLPQLVLVIVALLASAAGLAVLGWRSSANGRWDTLDTSITAAGAFLLAWVFFIDPTLARSASDFTTIVAVAIPAAALVVFAMAVKLAFGGALATWSGRMLLLATAAGLGTAGLVVAPIGAPAVPISVPILATWLAHMILLGAAGLAPGFTAVVRDRRRPEEMELPLGRTVLFVLLALVAPLNVAIGFSRAGTPGPVLAAIVVPPVCGTLILLILVIRLALVAQLARRRAEELSERSASLAAAMAKQDELQSELAYRALHDPLTGLANRDVLIERMDRLRDSCGRPGDQPCPGQALVMLDLDGFKHVNDTLGHPVGDQVLVDASRRLVGTVPKEALVARLGGDEFAVLVENVPRAEARRVAEAILEALRGPYFVAGREVFLTASIGLLITEPGVQPAGSAEGLRDVDHVLYDAKAAGRNRVSESHHRQHAGRPR